MEELRTLVVRARDGDLDAYGRIVRRFQDMAYGYAYARIGDFHLAEDAAQEAFVEAFRSLGSLAEPAAFPGWFRQIVFRRCSRLTRGRKIDTAPLEAAAGVASVQPTPADAAQEREMADRVLEAIQALPDDQRTATTLFYIDGYSQKDIAEFLEVPVTTVNNRLAASRKRLKERMLTMVEQTLHDNAPDERFSAEIIDALLSRPRPLEIEGHPVRQIADLLRSAMPDFQFIEGPEVVDGPTVAGRGTLERAYQPDGAQMLRNETTLTVLDALPGRTPPVRLATVGRVFRATDESPIHAKAFHQIDAICVAAGADLGQAEQAMRAASRAASGETELKFTDEQTWYVNGYTSVLAHWCDRWMPIGGFGVLADEVLAHAGFDPQQVSGFSFDFGLERLAMLKFDLDDVRKLWQPPYVPG